MSLHDGQVSQDAASPIVAAQNGPNYVTIDESNEAETRIT
jgi:hypothetical protein